MSKNRYDGIAVNSEKYAKFEAEGLACYRIWWILDHCVVYIFLHIVSLQISNICIKTKMQTKIN